jgi:hypothetical protein
MRLTLRTLLAYLDDTLGPNEAKEIGEKVAESDVAKDLVERIRKVTRRRRIGNPPIAGEGSKLDANTVAEYLSNVLSADETAEVEEICLNEDVYLAEVAACHQILTLMLSEPAKVPPTARQRMCRLVRGRESLPYRKPPVVPTDVGLVEIAPEDIDTGTSGHRRLAYLAVAVVMFFGLVVAVWMSLPESSAPRPHDPEVVYGFRIVPPSPATAKAEPDVPKIAAPVALPAGPKIEPKPEPKTAGPKIEPKVEPKTPIDTIAPAQPNSARVEIGKLAGDAVFLSRAAGAKTSWQSVASGAAIQSSDELLSLPGFRGDVRLASDVQVVLWGNLLEFIPIPLLESSATLHLPPAGVDADLTLHRGRVLLANLKRKGPAIVRVRFLNEIWDLTLAEKSEAIVDSLSSYAPGVRFSKQPGGESPQVQVFLGVPRGHVTLKSGYDEPLVLKAPPGLAQVDWNSKGSGRGKPIQLNAAPAHWSSELPTKSPAKDIAQQMQRVLTDFAARANRKGADIELTLQEQRQSPAAAARVYGMFGLAAIDSVLDVIDTLDGVLQSETRGASLYALRAWVSRSPANAMRLHGLLRDKKSYSEADADALVQLLFSFSDADKAVARTYDALFHHLENEKLAIRELAFWHLAQLDSDFARGLTASPAAADADVRTKILAQWRKRLTDGKLPPKAPDAAPK